MKAQWYAEALYGALQEIKTESDAKKVTGRFLKVVKARGHEKLLPFISRELGKIFFREKSKKEIVLVTADSKSKGKWAHAYDHYEKEGILPKGALLREVVDETIVGGFQIRMKDTLIDGSYKKSLLELYRNVTN